jgi:hypothetical protein
MTEFVGAEKPSLDELVHAGNKQRELEGQKNLIQPGKTTIKELLDQHGGDKWNASEH